MLKNTEFINAVQGMVNKGLEQNIVHLYTDEQEMVPGHLWLGGRQVSNFGSCSYLGMEFDERLKQGAIEGISRYGTQFSSSRAYISTGQYRELEEKLGAIFQAHPVIAPTTSLGHIATLPTLVGDRDMVLLDHQVHSSVQTAAKILKSRGIPVELIRHNRPDIIEEKIIENQSKYDKIWYLADGIYSMYGDGAPVEKLLDLMNRYEQFYTYVDDAHGMSCFGPRGSGYIMQYGPLHPKMILAVSFAKAFATGGAAIVFPDAGWAHTVRSCGGPLITSGPLQPATMGAACAMADIHLTDEIYDLQEDLHDKIKFTEFLLRKANLPLIKDNTSPVFFIGTSVPDAAFNVVGNMLNDGYYLNVSAFPVVPMKNAGIRFTITRNNDFSEIEGMVNALSRNFFSELESNNLKLGKIYTAFRKETPEEAQRIDAAMEDQKQLNVLEVVRAESITEIEASAWDRMFRGHGNYTHAGLRHLESAFRGNALPEETWDFDYVLVQDRQGKTVAATFFTTTLMKDDMLSDPIQSEIMETIRRGGDKYYMCSRVTMMGSLITEGEQLYIDRGHPMKQKALDLIFREAEKIQKERKAESLMLRDFDMEDQDVLPVAQSHDFLKKELPVNYCIDIRSWNDMDGYLNSLGYKSRRHLKRNVLPELDRYEVVHDKKLMDPADWYRLYLNVQENGRELNTFPMPEKFFSAMRDMDEWDILELREKTSGKVVCAVFSFITGTMCHTLLIGQDYDYLPYRPGMVSTIMRAKSLGCSHVQLGFSADMEKIRLGATGSTKCALIQTTDTFTYEYISMLSGKKGAHA